MFDVAPGEEFLDSGAVSRRFFEVGILGGVAAVGTDPDYVVVGVDFFVVGAEVAVLLDHGEAVAHFCDGELFVAHDAGFFRGVQDVCHCDPFSGFRKESFSCFLVRQPALWRRRRT
jgi:hypothetical protein